MRLAQPAGEFGGALLGGPEGSAPPPDLRDDRGLFSRSCMLEVFLEAADLCLRLGDLVSDSWAVGMLGGPHGDGEASRDLGGCRDLQLLGLVGVALASCQHGAEVDRRPDRLVDLIDHDPLTGQPGRHPGRRTLVGVNAKAGLDQEVVLGGDGGDVYVGDGLYLSSSGRWTDG